MNQHYVSRFYIIHVFVIGAVKMVFPDLKDAHLGTFVNQNIANTRYNLYKNKLL